MDPRQEQLGQLIFKIRNFGAIATARMDTRPAGLDINMAEFFLMKRVAEMDPENKFSLFDVQSCLCISKAGVSKMLGALEKKGYLVRDIDRSNRRNIIITLTARGCEVIKRLEGIVDDYLTEYASSLGEDDLKQLILIIDRLEKASEDVREKLRYKYFAIG